MKTNPAILDDVLKALRQSKKDSFPDHVCAMAAIVGANACALIATSIDWKYKRPDEKEAQDVIKKSLRSQAAQTAAAAIRFIENLPE
jgi:hypothetical protein